ncbi:HISTONE-LIKE TRANSCRIPTION FACTOR AND ARCHAEAL HISTONE FAMILY PROTEIN EXPRESSED [Salix koriyanagi]|uniref:HISTONE-LIKE TRANSCRIPTION FACTOR AND ARCHAEAL HISTONE FAMILY PROTEIN EXPRESSED n=1 Tax=Salix koriyanagi TaxID=2511006 RepID=A0A9Q0TQA3_9ROSI|nr:HISTONE-LIKE TRANSCRIPTION FACTOR AND ARCHAEAL HISTONE FAMILY PROTEIN EXPRESSED [Salix koriyanagi]
MITLWVWRQVQPSRNRRPKTTSNPWNSPSIARTFCRREMESAAKSKGKMKKKKSSGKEIVVVTKSKQEKKKSEIKTSSRSPREPVVLLLSSSSSSSGGGDSQKVIEIEGEDVEPKSRVKNRSTKISKIKNANNAKRKGKDGDFDGEGEEDGTACRFPMARIKRIIKSEDSDSLLSQDVVFLVNKATEKFLEQFSDEAYDFSVQDRKKSLAYKHLSTVVSKRRRFDFLSDFVPGKLKAKDALADRKLAMTGEG